MIVTVTSLRLRSLWHFFRLSLHGLKISLQARKQPGFVAMKNTGSGFMHYTCSAWKTEADMKIFARSGAHKEAMKESARISTEIRTCTFEAEKLPDWETAKQQILEKGKVLTF